MGVIIALPGEGTPSYRLRPVGGGDEWSAAADGTSLSPVPAKATHATPKEAGALYDHRAGQASLPLQVHFEDGSAAEVPLILAPADMERLYATVSRLLGDCDQKAAKE
ncbi:hypothetical protein E2651_02355 [Streptomyces sp. MZ04]|nr:hypothetical protein E2651_02355 [Streptomyces sp. MZ04]